MLIMAWGRSQADRHKTLYLAYLYTISSAYAIYSVSVSSGLNCVEKIAIKKRLQG